MVTSMPLHDLSPRVRSPDEMSLSIGTSTSIDFDELLGLDVLPPSALFTCERKTTRTLPALPPHRASWPHSRPAPPSPPLGIADVAVGMLVRGHEAWLRTSPSGGPSRTSVGDLCEQTGLLLACARHTWMASHPELDVLALVDCVGYGRTPPSIHPNASFDYHSPFDLEPAEWLVRPANGGGMGAAKSHLHLRCYWGPTGKTVRGWGGYRKTAALLRALHDVLPSKRFYVKIDEDTLLRPSRTCSTSYRRCMRPCTQPRCSTLGARGRAC